MAFRSRFSYLAAITLGFGLFIFLFGFAFGTHSASAASCVNPSPVPSGYAAPCPVLSLSSYSITSSGPLSLSLTPNASPQYIWGTVYLYNGSSWVPLVVSSNYLTTTTNYTIPASDLSALNQGTYYIASWDWTWNQSQGCYTGPGSTTCNTGEWRVQQFAVTNQSQMGVNDYYVSPTAGSDSYNGLSATFTGGTNGPWKTICHADDTLTLGSGGADVTLLPGQYDATNQLGSDKSCASTDNGVLWISTTHSGTATQRIKYHGTTEWGIGGAKIVGGWYAYGNYVDYWDMDVSHPDTPFNGFNIGRNLSSNQVVTDPLTQEGGWYTTVRFNYIHDINTTCASGDGDGGSGVESATHVQHLSVDSNIINNIGIDGGCSGQIGTGPLGVYITGSQTSVTNNSISNTQGGIQFNHDVCDDIAANNTVIHNYIYGILAAGWDGGSGTTECKAGDNNTAIIGNFLAENGFGCGVQNYGNGGQVAALGIWGISSDSTNFSISDNYLADNWTAGGAGCTSSPGTANHLFAGGGGYSSPGGNPNTFIGCGPPTCPNSTNKDTNIESTSVNGLVQSFGTSVVTGSDPALGGASNFEPLQSGPLYNAAQGNNYCTGSPGFSTPCVPTSDVVGNVRSSGNQSIGAYQF